MFKPRLQRLKWLYTDRPVYFLTACLSGRRPLLASAEVHTAFIEFARKATERGVWVGRFVLMPDHLHLFAAFRREGLSVSKWVQSLKVKLAQALREGGQAAPYWQKGFFDHMLRSAESYAQKWEYVRQNPVRAGLVNRWEEWLYQGEIHPLAVNSDL